MRSPLAYTTRTTLAVLALTACASAKGGSDGAAATTEVVGPQTPQRVDVGNTRAGQADVMNVHITPSAVEGAWLPVAASPARTWTALASAFGDLKLTPTGSSARR